MATAEAARAEIGVITATSLELEKLNVYDEHEVDHEVLEVHKGICACCGRLATTQCKQCQHAPSLAHAAKTIIPAWYCTPSCCLSDMPPHKEACEKLQHRIQICHTGHFLTTLWEHFRRDTWEYDVRSVTLVGDRLVMQEGDRSGQLRDRFVRSFPESLTDDPALQSVMLTYNTCEAALIWLRPLLEDLLEAEYTKIEVVRTEVRNPPIRPCMISPSGIPRVNTPNHLVWKVTMKTGEKWVIDVTSMSHGWPESVMSWSSWLRERAGERTHYVEHFKTWNAFFYAHYLMGGLSLFDFYLWREQEALGEQVWLGFREVMNDQGPDNIGQLKTFFRGQSDVECRKRRKMFEIAFRDMARHMANLFYEKHMKELRAFALGHYLDMEHVRKYGRGMDEWVPTKRGEAYMQSVEQQMLAEELEACESRDPINDTAASRLDKEEVNTSWPSATAFMMGYSETGAHSTTSINPYEGMPGAKDMLAAMTVAEVNVKIKILDMPQTCTDAQPQTVRRSLGRKEPFRAPLRPIMARKSGTVLKEIERDDMLSPRASIPPGMARKSGTVLKDIKRG